jgi:excisionase family DNA binding protein
MRNRLSYSFRIFPPSLPVSVHNQTDASGYRWEMLCLIHFPFSRLACRCLFTTKRTPVATDAKRFAYSFRIFPSSLPVSVPNQVDTVMQIQHLPPLDVNQRYTINEAAAYLRQSRSKTYTDIKEGSLPVIKDGARTYVPGRAIAKRSGA